MNENIAPITARRVVLLVKSQKFANQAGYYLFGGRWHASKQDKPAPKGVPVLRQVPEGHNPKAGHKELMTDAMWAKVYEHPDNSNKANFTKKLDQIKAAYDAGDAHGILSLNYPADTTHKKLAHIGNYLLGLMGNEHQIVIGQKKGEHAALKQAPAETPAVAAPAQSKEAAEPVAQAEKPAPAPEASEKPAAAPGTGSLSMPAFVEGKTTTGVVSYYEGQAQKILDMVAAGDAEGLAEMKAQGLTPNSKGKISNTFKGKTENSKLLIALHDQAVDQVGKKVDAVTEANPPAPEPAKEAPAIAEPKPAMSFNELLHSDDMYLSQKLQHADGTEQAVKLAHNYVLSQSASKVAYDEAIQDLKDAGYYSAALELASKKADAHGADEVQKPAPEDGPKDGDTKQGAEGMLVFKDGHWHKQDEPKADLKGNAEKISSYLTANGSAETQAEGKALFDALPPDLQQNLKQAVEKEKAKAAAPAPTGKKLKPAEAIALGKGLKTASGMKAKLKKLAVAGDVAGLQEFVAVANGMPASKKYAQALIAAMTDSASDPAKATTAAPHADQNAIPAMDGWQQVGQQAGSNPGGKFVDEHGTEWYCKFPGNEDVAKSEVLAAKLYAAAGVAGQDAMLVTKGGKLGIASKWQDVQKASSPAALAKVDGVASGFAADAWLGNWDVVGLGYDNLQVDANGNAMRVDAGGSLEYRAQGGKKSFGNVVTELDSLRDAKINPQSAAVFGKLSKADITAGVAKVLKVSDAQIHALVNTFGPGDAAHKKALAETLIARKADLLAKFPKAKKEKKHTFKPEKISAPPSFMNWGGSGKDGPSSKPFLNQANEKAVQSIYEAAKTGSIDAVKNLSADTFNKNTGEVVGSAPVLEHPSQHVKGYAQQAINEINYQLNPPKRFRFEGGHPLESLHAAYPSHTGGAHADTVEKAGKFLVLGEPGKVSLDSLALPKITHASGQLTKATYSPAAVAAINAMPETQKQAIKQYTGSSYVNMNTSLWSGNPSGAAKAAGEALKTMGHEIKPGTVLSRKLSVSGAALDQILKSTGKVLQEPAIMSTSIRPSSWGGNVQLKLHVGPGVKGLWVGYGSAGANKALSVNAGEDELILPPNTRLLILSVKKSNGADADGFGASSQHVIEAVVLPTQQAH